MAGQVEDEREHRQDGGAERTPGAEPPPLPGRPTMSESPEPPLPGRPTMSESPEPPLPGRPTMSQSHDPPQLPGLQLCLVGSRSSRSALHVPTFTTDLTGLGRQRRLRRSAP
jgi:hypothetical protein